MICRPGTLSDTDEPHRHRKDVDKEFPVLFMIMDENESWYIDENIRHYLGCDPDAFERDAGFKESNTMHGESWKGAHRKNKI